MKNGGLQDEKKYLWDFPWAVQESVPADGPTCLRERMETIRVVFIRKLDIQETACVFIAIRL